MPQAIQVLSEETINQIAAGEVIEDPSSVVKELVENGVDAQATRITLEIKGGGFQEICVSDNGKGMSREDLFLCLERHATSKIRFAEDLSSIFCMGFRGEALASIAAISKITVTTCQKNEAHELYAEGGKILSLKEAARNPGTTVQISSLFYNVPARRKFQKSARSAQNEIVKMLTKLALAHPFLEVKCLADGKEVFSSFMKRAEEKEKMTEQVIEKVLGSSFLEGASTVHFKKNGCFILGHVGAAHLSRKSRAGQYLFVNGRSVISPQISRAIYAGYGTRLPSNEHPTFVLNLTLPTEWIDVNVHPQKKEIRLREESQIEGVIREGVFNALQGSSFSSPSAVSFEEVKTPFDWSSEVQPALKFREQPQTLVAHFPTLKLPIIGLYSHYLILDACHLDSSIFHGGEEGLVLVDLELAQARLMFEAMLDRLEGKGEMQALLFPITFELSTHEKGVVEMHLETLQKLGIAIREFGGSTFVVDAIDPYFEEDQVESLVHELIDTLQRFGDHEELEEEKKKKLALRTLRFVRSQKESYTIEEAKALVTELFKAESPYQSPTGSPTCAHLNQDELNKYFR